MKKFTREEIISLLKESIDDQKIIDELNEIPESKRTDPNPDELKMGIAIESDEHGLSREEAEKIALDHLKEDSFYYTHLKEQETQLKFNKIKTRYGTTKKQPKERSDLPIEISDKDIEKWKKENVVVIEQIKKIIRECIDEIESDEERSKISKFRDEII
jgi:hypothetical protein